MAKKITLKAEKRKVLGRKVKNLRKESLIPANVYGKGLKSQSIQVTLKDFQKIYDEAGETNIVYLTLGKSKKPVLIHNLQNHPVSHQILHVDFHQVDLKQKTTAEIPIVLKGEAPAIAKGGILVQLLDEVKVEALPKDLPDEFVIDISALGEIGQALALKDIKFDRKKVKLLVDSENQLVVNVEAPKAEEEEKPKEEEVEKVAEAEKLVEEGKPEQEAEERPPKADASRQAGKSAEKQGNAETRK